MNDNNNASIDKNILESELNNLKKNKVIDNFKAGEENSGILYTLSASKYKYKITENGTVEEISGITLSKAKLKMLAGQEETITATLTEGVTGTVNWTSSNSDIVTVENGKITIASGATAGATAKITATVNEYTQTCEVTVISAVTQISVSDLIIEQGSAEQLKVMTEPSSNIEDLTYKSSDDKIATVDYTGKVTGISSGTVTITVAGKISTAVTTTCTVKVTGLEVGSYVNYPVDYDNVGTYDDGETYIPKDEYAGKWRILDLGNYDESTKTYSNTKIVSAGVPLNFYLDNNSSASVTKLTTGFFSTPINEEKPYYNYYRCGFMTKDSNNNRIPVKVIGDVKELFNNNITKKDLSGNPEVQSMTKADLDKVYDPAETSTTSIGTCVNADKFNDMLAIPSKNPEENYAYYWLASASDKSTLWYVCGEYRIITRKL